MRQLKISKSITNRELGSLDKYLADIAREEMVTPEEEVVLAKKIREGDPIALERLVKANLRFVVSVAKQYQNQGLSLPDLINEGNVGLIKAAKRFDETKGFKFISYAVWWIRQSILQAVAEQSRLVRLPLNQVGNLSKIKKTTSRLEQLYQRQPTVKEIAEELDIPENKVLAAFRLNVQEVSVDAPIGDDNDISFAAVAENSLLGCNEFTAESFNCGARAAELFLSLCAFHCRKCAAHLYEGEAVFAEYVERRNCTGGNNIKAFTHFALTLFLSAGMNYLGSKAELFESFAHEGELFARTVKHCKL